MLLFCPTCSNLLTITRISPSKSNPDSRHLVGKNAFTCSTCPYHYPLDKRYYERKLLPRKDVDDILGGKEAWANAQKTEVNCNDGCGGVEAYYYTLQIRSADEPSTAFYKCVKCGKRWNE